MSAREERGRGGERGEGHPSGLWAGGLLGAEDRAGVGGGDRVHFAEFEEVGQEWGEQLGWEMSEREGRRAAQRRWGAEFGGRCVCLWGCECGSVCVCV